MGWIERRVVSENRTEDTERLKHRVKANESETILTKHMTSWPFTL